MKKAISFILAALMVCGVMPVTALAANSEYAVYKYNETVHVYGVIYDDGNGNVFYFNNETEPYDVSVTEQGTMDGVMSFDTCSTADAIAKEVEDWADDMGVENSQRSMNKSLKCPPYPYYTRSLDPNPDTHYESITNAQAGELITRYAESQVVFEGHIYNEPTPITEMTATVSGFAAGATPAKTAVSTTGEGYTVSVYGWYDCESPFEIDDNRLADNAALEGGRAYVVGVLFTADRGYEIASAPVVTINGETGALGGNITGSRAFYVAVDIPEAPLNGWQKIDGSWYYYKNGAVQTGWLKDGGKWYFLNSDGVMQTGWVKDGGKWYYMQSSGAMKTGWLKDGGKWYYLQSSGAMSTGWQKIGNTWYYFKSNGAMVTGWQKVGGAWYYFQSSGAMKTGWLKDGGKWYYLESSGAMLANTSRKIGNKTYKFNSSGVCTNP